MVCPDGLSVQSLLARAVSVQWHKRSHRWATLRLCIDL